MGEPSVGTPPSERPPENRLDRLDSWKEIAAYLKRDVTTVQRWERREAMPVHRHLHDRMGSVYAFRAELDDWARSRSPRPTPDDGVDPKQDTLKSVSGTQENGIPQPAPADDEPPRN